MIWWRMMLMTKNIFEQNFLVQVRFTYQRFIAFDQLYYFHGFLIFVNFNRNIWQVRIKVFLRDRIMSGQ